MIVSFVKNYAAAKSHNHDGVYAKSSHVHTTAQVTGLDAALAGKAPSTHSHAISQVTNLQSSLDGKVPTGRLINKKALSKDITLTSADVGADAQGSAATALDSAKTYTDTVAKTKAALSHTHTIAQVTDLQASLDSKQPKGSYASSSHTHTIANVTNLQSQLDGKQPKGSYAASSHNHDASNITSGTVSTDRLPVMPVSKGGTGHTSLVDSANSMIDSLTIGAVTPSDNDYVISQVADSGVAHKKPMSSIWIWIKSKCDALYQAKGSYASSSHTHSWSQITGKPSIPSALTYMPVGYVYISWSSTSPASMFGGSWTAITGRFPYFNAGTGTGGSNSHTLSINELPNHTHNFHMPFSTVWTGNGGGAIAGHVTKNTVLETDYVKASGGSQSHNNMPSYQTLYAWRRTA